MTWAKLDDGIYRNAKLLACSPGARWFYIAAIAYSRDQQTAGHLDAAAVTFLVRGQGVRQRVVDELARVGCLVSDDGGFEIHDYDQFNPLTSTERVRKHRGTHRKQKGNVSETPGERSLVRASATGLETDRTSRLDPVPVPAPGDAVSKTLDLAVEIADVLGVSVLAPLEIQACEEALIQFPYLIQSELVERAKQHQQVCTAKGFPLARTVQGLWEAWRSQNDYNADHGRLKPRGPSTSAMTKAFQ